MEDFINQGNDYFHKKEYDNAIDSYKKAIEINPKDDEAYCNMGIAYRVKKEYDNAIDSYKKAIEINPKYDKAYYNMGNAYDEKEEHDNAIDSYKKAIEINPKYDKAYYNMGIAYGAKKEYDNAIDSYKKAIEINPKDDEAYYNMGFAYDEKKEYDNAIDSYKKAIEINPKTMYKEHLDYIKNKIEVEKQQKKLEKEMEIQADSFDGKAITERIKNNEEELTKLKGQIETSTVTLITSFIFALITIVAVFYYSHDKQITYLIILQANLTTLFMFSPLVWALKTKYTRKNILELSIADLQDKHYLISLFMFSSKEKKEEYTKEMLRIFSNDSTAKLLAKMHSSKIETIPLIGAIKDIIPKKEKK